VTAKARLARAEKVVARTLAELPPEIQPAAQAVPCLFQDWCEDDPELLGTYGDFAANEVSDANGPIILYLAAIEDYAEAEGARFDDEVRITYLHELGHHFGWGEGELEERGLA
jgi:predicted Zn-dependent protease with MMP-like domain